MAVQAMLDTLEGVPEAIAAEYRKEGEKFVLDVIAVDGFELADTSGLKSALQKERQNYKTLENKFSGMDDLLENADSARDAMKRLKELEEKGGSDKEIEVLKEQLRTQSEKDVNKHKAKFEQDLAASNERVSKLDSQLRKVLLEEAATNAINAAGGNARLLKHIVLEQARLSEENGEYKVEVRDPKNPDIGRLSPKSGSSDPMSLVELVEEFKNDADLASCFPSNNAGGSGSQNNHNGQGGRSTNGQYTISQEQGSDPQQYRAAREHAEKNGLQLMIEE